MAPGINLAFNHVTPGGKMIGSLYGWAPDQPISLNIPNALSLPSVMVDSSGNSQFAIEIPTSVIPGSYVLQAHNSSDNTSAIFGFIVDPTYSTIFPLMVALNYQLPLYSNDANGQRNIVSFQITNIGNEAGGYNVLYSIPGASGVIKSDSLLAAGQAVISFTPSVSGVNGSSTQQTVRIFTNGVIQGQSQNFISIELQWYIIRGNAPPGFNPYVSGAGIQGSSLTLVNPINQGGGTRTDLSILVSDKATNQPIANASVTLTGGGNITGTTGTGGIFESVIPQGSYTLSVTASNYDQFVGTVNVTGSTMNYGVQLVANSTTTPPPPGPGITKEFEAFIAWLEKNPIASAFAAGLILFAATNRKDKKRSVTVVRA